MQSHTLKLQGQPIKVQALMLVQPFFTWVWKSCPDLSLLFPDNFPGFSPTCTALSLWTRPPTTSWISRYQHVHVNV
jgi:hypothetical protein